MSSHLITSRSTTGKHDAKMARLGRLVAALAASCAITTAWADTVTFRQGAAGYTGGVDTMLQQDPANAGTNNGAGALTGWDGDDPSGTGFDIYTLIRFNNIFGSGPGQIPVGAVITSATLTYTVSDVGDTGSVRELLVGWTAASTFNSFCGASCDEGSEYGPPVANAPAGAIGTQTIDVRSSVQAWSDGGTNNGWMMVPTGSGGVDIRSNEHATLSERPLLTVIFNQGTPSANLVRQPYLQMASDTRMTVAWRTDTATNSQVRYGTAVGVPTQQATNAAVSTDHFVTITGLLPATRYYYDVGSTTAVQAGGSAQHYFETSPAPGNTAPFRVWVLGDSGTLFPAQLQVRNAMQAYTASNPPDLMLHVGDIAYDTGSDTEFTQKHFNVYQDIMRHTPSWHTLGNHEGTSTISGQPGASSGPYYTGFVLPMAGEAGGEPSGTEAYYSFDYGSTHFICLNSTQVSRSATGPMAMWLQADLAATNAQWVVAFWHHPPYSHGTHNSDSDIELVQMRENIMPILEAGGVDLVLSGHSHGYERSYLINGTYVTPTPSFATLLGTGHILDDGDGKPAGDGAYLKSPGINAHEGEVVLVAGHGGANTGGSLNHPVMFHSESANGSVILDIAGNSLSAVNLRYDGVVTDSFTLMKGDLPPRVSQTAPPKDDVLAALSSITVTFSTPVTGVSAGDLSVNGSPATVLTPINGSTYTFSGLTSVGPGLVSVSMVPGGIADAGNPTLLFTGDSWTYEINTAPPAVLLIQPDRGTHTSLLDNISVTFTKPVVNVTPDDLRVNGSPATTVLGISGTPGPYQFSGYAPPAPGLVNVTLLADGIQDTQLPVHNFAGDAWTYVRTQSLVINEFLASNNTTVTDENGEFDDYLEIFNPGVDPVDMSGMFLTDVLGFPASYRIPLGVTIPAGGHLVFWCDSQPSQGPMHTSFNLLRTGEEIGLFSSEAEGIQPIDTLSYTTQTTDVAFGRFKDGASTFVTMPATPGATNTINCTTDGGCVALDSACTDGVCSAGRCTAQPVNEGLTCSTGVACLTGEVCGGGICDGGTSTCTGGQTCDLDTGQCLTLPAPPLPVAVGSAWRYLPGTAEPNSLWKTLAFDDSTWSTGASGFGYGPDCNTPALRGTTLATMQNSYVSLYTRKTFSVPNPALLTSLTLTVDYDDGWVAYLNGTEVARSPGMGGTVGVPPAFNAVTSTTDHECSTGSPANPAETFNLTSSIPLLQAGNNLLAIQGHNRALTSSDFSLIPSLTATQTAGCASNADCADGNPCTDDLCTLATGVCSNLTDNTNLCSDGVACTSDVCDGGACLSTSTCPFGETCDAGTGQCGAPSSTVTFQDGTAGYTATTDTFVQAGTPTTSNATATTLIVDGPPPATDERQTLLRFDNLFESQGGPVPDGAVILSASLTLNITNPSASGAELHRMLIPWLDTDTWNSLGLGVQANDVEAVAAADTTSLFNGTVPATHVIDVTASVASWSLNPSSNHGWALITPAGGSDSWQFDSSEGATAGLRPSLSITYSTAQGCTTDEDCNDFDACTGTETCSAGICQPGIPLVCNDGNTCTTDSCVPATGCVFTNNTNPCNDNNACTGGDICGSGVCSGAALSCNDGVACTADSCNTATGCINTSTCTGGQTCNLGTGLCESASVQASFQDGVGGYTATVDTYLHAGSPTADNSLAATLIVDGPTTAAPGDERQTLIRFDNLFASQGGPIPNGATIVSATLTLNITNVSPDGAELHRMLIPWADTATWNSMTTGVQRDGVESVAAADVTSSYNGTVPATHAITVTSSVAAWSANPASNYGWVFVTPAGLSDSWQFDSSEGATAVLRPRLSITFSGAPGCVTNGDCNDGVACTADTCQAGVCVNADACTGGATCNTGTGQCEAAPVTVSYQDGASSYAGTQDTWLAEAAATTINGAVEDWRWDLDDPSASGFDAFGLIRFDSIFGSGPGQIPPGSTITSATLTLQVFNASAAPAGTINVALVDWSEATATWNNFGGDAGVDASEYGALVGDAPISTGAAPINVTASVQAWSNSPSSNFGWVFRPNSTDGAQVRSAEYLAAPAERPRLSVTYVAPVAGCVNDADCDDHDACTGVEVCSAGTCLPGTALTCNDGNACTTDTCAPASGCVFTNNTSACNDGNACTAGDVCGGGVCAGTVISCDDGVACTADSCNSGIGCVNTSTCTGGQTCNLGTGLCESAPTLASFQDGAGGYTATVDTYVHAGLPTADNSLVTPLIVDGPAAGAPGDERQVLLRFDNLFVSQGGPIPDGATIQSATLTLNITDPSPDGAELHRMLVSWADTATWNSLTAGVQHDGTEALAAIDVSSSFNGTVPASHAIAVTSSVAAWSANPSSNHGWVFVTPAGLSNSWQFSSSEAATVALRPMLTVQYQAITGPQARIDCSLSSPTSPPGGVVGVDARLINLGGLVPVRGYQTKLLVTRTSGSGTLDLGCPGGVLVDEGRSDFLFSGQASVFSVTNCGQALASSSLLSGAVPVGPGGAYLSTYSLTASTGAAPGSTFEVSFAAFPGTALADAAADPIAFTQGPVCTVTITGECSTDPQCDDVNPCTNDVCSSGTCTHPPNTASCDDGNACTTGDTCGGGACVPGTPVVCNDGNTCTDDACNPSNGSCVFTNDDGNTCSDGDACTPVDSCVDGACVAGTPISCDDGNSCTSDSCSAGACQHGNSGACGVSGNVRYYRNSLSSSEPSAKPVPDVGVDGTSDAVADDQTDGSGLYAIGSLFGNVTIAPLPKYGNPRASDHNGAITSFDASLAAQHSVLLITLSPNQQLAADVTGNGSVSSLDASFISQFAIQMIDHFGVATLAGSDWRFLRCDTYVDAANNTCGPASFTHAPLISSPVDDFFAILYGDVSGNWASAVPPLTGQGEEAIAADDAQQARALKLAGVAAPGRPAGLGSARLSIEGWNGPLLAGQRRELLVVARDADGIQGLDLALGFDAGMLRVVGVEPAGIGAGLAAVTHHDGEQQRIAAYGPVPLSGSGAVLKITVEAAARIGRSLPISLMAEANEGRIPLRVIGGRPAAPRPSRKSGGAKE